MKALISPPQNPENKPQHENKSVRLDRILVPTDFSPLSRLAIDATLSLFRDNPRISLTLLNVLEPLPVVGMPDIVAPVDFALEKRVEFAERDLERLRSTYGPQINLEARMLSGSTAQTICDLARDEHFDLIVLSSHGLTGLSRILIGSVAERVVQNALCPVLVIKPPKNEQGQFLPDPAELKLDHLLVGYDHRKGAERALEMAMHLVERSGADVTLIHALEPANNRVALNLLKNPEGEAICVNEARANLNLVRIRHLPDSANWKLEVEIGHPWDVLSEAAKETSSDLIVIGHHDHTRWGHSFAGSTAQRVVRLAPCAVLAVKW